MNLGITGASGLIGRHLLDVALRRGHEVIAFSRNPARGLPGCTMRPFFEDRPPDFSDCEAIIHLAGESVLGLWSAAKKNRIRSSRVQGTALVAEAIVAMRQPPEAFVNGSAIGFYGDSGDLELTETSPAGTGFLSDTCVAWETAAQHTPAERVVLLRTGLVLSPKGGALGMLAPLFRLGLGGRLGSGQQWMSWIHLDDLVGLILFCVENTDVSGPVNGTAPWPVRNIDFTRLLAAQVHRPAPFAVPAFALKLLGEFSHELLDSKRVLPAVATSHGFPFRYPELAPALKNLL